MSLLDKLAKFNQEKGSEKKDEQKPVEIKDLKPPKAPKVPPKIDATNDKEYEEFKKLNAISGYMKWILSDDTQRSYYIARTGDTHRKSGAERIKDLESKQQDLAIIKQMDTALLLEIRKNPMYLEQQKSKYNK